MPCLSVTTAHSVRAAHSLAAHNHTWGHTANAEVSRAKVLARGGVDLGIGVHVANALHIHYHQPAAQQ